MKMEKISNNLLDDSSEQLSPKHNFSCPQFAENLLHLKFPEHSEEKHSFRGFLCKIPVIYDQIK